MLEFELKFNLKSQLAFNGKLTLNMKLKHKLNFEPRFELRFALKVLKFITSRFYHIYRTNVVPSPVSFPIWSFRS